MIERQKVVKLLVMCGVYSGSIVLWCLSSIEQIAAIRLFVTLASIPCPVREGSARSLENYERSLDSIALSLDWSIHGIVEPLAIYLGCHLPRVFVVVAGLSGYNVGSLHPIANYGPSYVDGRQPVWQQGTADYAVGQSTMSEYSSTYGLRQSSVVGRGSRLPPMSGYGASSYGGVGQAVITDPTASFRGGRQPSMSAARGMASVAGSRQLSTTGYGSYGDSRHAVGTVQDYGDHMTSSNSNGVNWPASMNYQPRYSGAG